MLCCKENTPVFVHVQFHHFTKCEINYTVNLNLINFVFSGLKQNFNTFCVMEQGTDGSFYYNVSECLPWS